MTNTELLLDTLDYYTVDPVGRKCTDDYGNCRYSPKSIGKEETSAGCAIGRLLSPELAQKIDDKEGEVGIHTLIREGVYDLPDFMNMDNMYFLGDCQGLHDLSSNWTDTGLSAKGQITVTEMIKKYNLDVEQFSKFLN